MIGLHFEDRFIEAFRGVQITGRMAFDRRVFPPAERFDAEYWALCDAWWMLVDGVKAGCCAGRSMAGACVAR